MKTIGYVTAADPFHDRKAWSGTIYKVREAIERTQGSMCFGYPYD